MYNVQQMIERAQFLLNLFQNIGKPFLRGCSESESLEQIRIAQSFNTEKPIRAISQWLWIDISNAIYADDELQLLQPSQYLPALLKANLVEYDESSIYEPGHWLISTAIKERLSDCIYETEDAVYVLIGAGNIHSVSFHEYEIIRGIAP